MHMTHIAHCILYNELVFYSSVVFNQSIQFYTMRRLHRNFQSQHQRPVPYSDRQNFSRSTSQQMAAGKHHFAWLRKANQCRTASSEIYNQCHIIRTGKRYSNSEVRSPIVPLSSIKVVRYIVSALPIDWFDVRIDVSFCSQVSNAWLTNTERARPKEHYLICLILEFTLRAESLVIPYLSVSY